MNQSDSIRIEVPAVHALAEWKELFAKQVFLKAKELSEKADAGTVTLEHYRQAAGVAVQTLAIAIQGTDLHDGHQEAA